MGNRHHFNDTPNVAFVGGKMIPPGEGRDVESDEPESTGLQAESAADADGLPAPDLDANLRDLLAQPLKVLTPLLGEHSDDTLAAMARIEGEKPEPRKTLLAAIAELQLERALAKAGAPT